MKIKKITFVDGWDYLDFAWFLDQYDPKKQADNFDIERIYEFYKSLVESYMDGDNIRNYLKCQLSFSVVVCPCCKGLFNTSVFPYQVNDNFSLTFCSYSCSEKYTVKHLQSLIDDDMTFSEIAEGI